MGQIDEVEAQTKAVQGAKHVPELQAFRGLAALAVLVHHCSFYFAYDPGLRRVSEIAINAHAAVVSFFVLSGLVLAMSLSRGALNALSIAEFYLRRCFRIYPALWVGCALALCYIFLFDGVPKPAWVSDWFPDSYRQLAGEPRRWIPPFLALGQTLPIPMWSLIVELAGSILMPLIVLAMRRSILFWALGLILLVLSFLLPPGGALGLMAYLPHFLFGAAIYKYREALERALADRRAALIAAAAGFVVLWFGRTAIGDGWSFGRSYHSVPASLIEGVGATALVAALYVNRAVFPFLQSRILLWLGDISYSLYLIHLPIMALIAGICGELLGLSLFATPLSGTVLLTALTLGISATIATLSYRFVEIPGIQLGKGASRLFRLARPSETVRPA